MTIFEYKGQPSLVLDGVTAVDAVYESRVTVWWGTAWKMIQLGSHTAAHRYRKELIDAIKQCRSATET